MNQLSLSLFGSFTAAASSFNLRLPTDKTRALLAYLALTADVPLRRETLAGLFWPDQPEVLARQNLRKTVGRLRQAIYDEDAELADRLLTLTKQTVELHGDYCPADVVTFRRHLEVVQKHPHKRLEQCHDCLTRLETAVTLYRQGDFLAGLSLPDAYPFEEWLVMQRENLYQQQLAALHRLTVTHEQQGTFEKAAQYAQWQIQQEPWREEAHRQLMRLLAGQGQRAEAIAQYQACRQLLQAELGVEPAAETESLLAQIVEGAFPVMVAQVTAAQPQQLPKLLGQLVGREAEVAQVISLLAEPGCRVLTVTGPGGIGKTSLAIAVGEQLRREAPDWLHEGVYFVSLAEITNATLLPAAVSEALGITLNKRQTIASQVEQFLKHRGLLLILDNFEHLVSEVGWLHQLTTTSSQLKLLITSRQPLDWQGEWRYPLEGLAYPQEGTDGSAFEAVQLFVQAARQLQPTFAYTAENGRAIDRICQLVYGWPLALQMAAAWVRMMNCQAIAEQISTSLDFLTTSLRDVPPRQRSMRAIFEHTWRSLSGEERAILGQLAIFRGGFTLAAAGEVAAASPLLLLGLVDKSLVQVEERSGRYTLHEILRQFAHEKAQTEPDAYDVAQQNHGRYYLRLLHTEGERLNTVQFQAALEVIKADIDNVRQAWLWAASGRQDELVRESLSHLAKFYESAGPPQEAVAFFGRTIGLLEERGQERPAALIASIMYQIAESLITMGQYGEATSTVSTAQNIAQALGDVSLINLLFITQAHIFREQGRYEETHAVLREAIGFSHDHKHLEGVARALHVQGNTYWSMAAYEQARQCYEEGRQIYQQLGQLTYTSVLTGNIGVVQWRLGQYAEALRNYEVALEAQHKTGNAAKMAVWLGNIGLLYVDLHQDERALTYLDEALKIHDQVGRKYNKIEPLLGKVALYLREGDIEAAVHVQQQATELSYEISNRTYLLDCDLWLARVYVAQQRTAEAHQLLQSLLGREFRPDMLAIIAQEIEQLAKTAAVAY